MAIAVINKLKSIIICKTYETNKMAMLKLAIGLIMLMPLSYHFVSFYYYVSVDVFLVSVDDMLSIPFASAFEAQRALVEATATDAPYFLYAPAIIMMLGYYIHYLRTQKSWRKYFRIIAVFGVIFLYNACLVYFIGRRSYEIDVFFNMAKSDSIYGLAEMVSGVTTWAGISGGVLYFVVWSAVLHMTINAYNQLCIDKSFGASE